MDWYYAEGNERRGPIPESEMAGLIASGKIQANTLVWNATMKDWTQAAATSLLAGAPPPSEGGGGGATTEVCIMTGQRYPTSHMLKTEHGWVSGDARDAYFQALRERAPIPFAGGLANVFGDRKYVVVPVDGARLPPRCVKTNEPVTADEMKPRVLYWCTPWAFLAVLLNIIILLILYLILRKKVKVAVPLSARGRSQLFTGRAIAWSLFLVGVALVFVPIAYSNLIGLLPVAVILMLASAVVGLRRGTLLRVAKYRDGMAWLSGAHPDFVAALPRYGG